MLRRSVVTSIQPDLLFDRPGSSSHNPALVTALLIRAGIRGHAESECEHHCHINQAGLNHQQPNCGDNADRARPASLNVPLIRVR